MMPITFNMSVRLQVAGGLALHRLKRGTFADILKPAADNLVLTGDCFTPGDPITSRFINYVGENWKRVFILAGPTEQGDCEKVSKWNSDTWVYCTNIQTMDLGRGMSASRNRLMGVTYRPTDPAHIRDRQVQAIQNELDKGHRTAVVSYGRIDAADAFMGDVTAVIQGCGEFNQFNPKRGPVMNRRTDRNFLPKSSYRPDFVIDLDPFIFPGTAQYYSMFPHAVTGAWPVALTAPQQMA